MPKIVVTGGSGLLGADVVKHFVEEGYEVINADRKYPAPEKRYAKTVITDLEDLGQVYGVLAGADAVIHLAAIPVAYSHANEVTFRNNTMTAYNILEAASGLGIRKAVLASSESSYGIVFAKKHLSPQYVPLDEDHPQLPQDSYGLSKIVNEKTADMFHRQTGMQVVSLRLGNVISPEMYAIFPSFIHDASKRKVILWSYIDTRDAAVACQLAIEKEGLGSVALNLASDDTSMDLTNGELMQCYPDVTDIRVDKDGYDTLFSNRKAKEILGWKPTHFWRDHVPSK